MIFSNLIFLYLFLPLTVGLYFLVPGLRAKNVVLLIASLIFYAWGEPVYVLLMMASAGINYAAGRLMAHQSARKTVLILAVAVNLGLLGVFKYAGFFVENLNAMLGLSLPVPEIALPIGISFYTFQAMSYVVDVYRDNVKIQRSYWKFLLYVSLFPQLIAGPIVRYADVETQLASRKTTGKDAFDGMTRFCIGLGKKVLLADYAGKVADELLASTVGITTVGAWLGAVLVMLQIYFDFSGYSDMAIGLGRVFGFRYRENFNLPYTANSITDFWRRWHISLSSFFRDYVYIPLGGNRKGKARQIFNLFVVWALTGLWHGASWNFVLWGIYFFVLLVAEKLLGDRLKKIPSILRHVLTLFFVLISWVIFHFENLSDVGRVLAAMFGAGTGGLTNTIVKMKLTNCLPLLAVCVVGCTSLPRKLAYLIGGGPLYQRKRSGSTVGLEMYNTVVAFLFCAAVLFLATTSLIGSGYSPFLYFRF